MCSSDLLVATAPLLFLSGWACLLLLADLWIPKNRKAITAWLALIGLAITCGLVLPRLGLREEAFGGMLAIDEIGRASCRERV